MRPVKTVICNNKAFRFNRMFAVDCLKLQLFLAGKVKMNEALVSQFAKLDENFFASLIMIVFGVVQSFSGDEFINFANDLFNKSQCRIDDSNRERLPDINTDFDENPSEVYGLIFEILKENVDFSFFMKRFAIQVSQEPVAKEEVVPVKLGAHFSSQI
jgi:hypothetical protein